jgi:hypothetical protein
MDQATQQNAALVEEASAAAQSLREEADSLAHTVGTFRLHAGAPATAPAPVAKPASRAVVPVAAAPRAAKPAAAKAAPAKREPVVAGGEEWEEF